MRRHLILLSGLALIWCLLSGHYTQLLLLLGVMSCLLCYGAYEKMATHTTHPKLIINPLGQVRYLVWLVVEIVKSNLDVMVAILSPGKIKPQVFSVQTGDLDEMGRVVYANSITLTPGTVSIEVCDSAIEVHTLLQKTRDDLETDHMLHRVEMLRQIRRVD